MKRQRGQSAVEFALISPIIFLLIFAAVYGGAMFIQFLNFNNEARTVVRQIALMTSKSDQDARMDDFNEIGEKQIGIYYVKGTVWRSDDDDIVIRYDFNRTEFPFGFPPAHFATSFTMKSEAKES